jgi:plastocyanin
MRTSAPPRRLLVWLGALGALGGLAALAAACIDLGYDAQRFVAIDASPIDAAGSGSGSGSGSACTEGPTAPTTTGPQLHFASLAVDQRTLRIRAGDVVTWTNQDSMTHTATQGVPGAAAGFDSGDIGAGAKWAYRFCAAKNLVWFCKTHGSQMNGYRITVE